MFLLDDILFSPLKGLIWLAEKVDEVAARELSDEGHLKDKLMELQLRFELDEINEEEYTRQETELLDRLNAIREEQEDEVSDDDRNDQR